MLQSLGFHRLQQKNMASSIGQVAVEHHPGPLHNPGEHNGSTHLAERKRWTVLLSQVEAIVHPNGVAYIYIYVYIYIYI